MKDFVLFKARPRHINFISFRMADNADEVVKMLKDMNLNKDVRDVFLQIREYLGFHITSKWPYYYVVCHNRTKVVI